MSDILAVSILELSSSAKQALQRNGVETLNEQIAHRGFGFLTSENYDPENLNDGFFYCDRIFHDRVLWIFSAKVHNISPFRVEKKSHPYFLHNIFLNPIASKWILSIG